MDELIGDDEDEEVKFERLTDYLSDDGKVLTLYVNDPISKDSLNNCIDAIMLANMHRGNTKAAYGKLTHINIFVRSEGGCLTATCQLLSAIDISKVPVRTIGWGECCSGGIIILMAGHERLVSEHAMLMSHYASFTLGFATTHVADRSKEDMSKTISEIMNRFYMKYTKKPLSFIKRHLIKANKDDVYLTADKAIACGVADGLFTDYEQLLLPPKI